MPRVKLTDLSIKSLKPRDKSITYWDESLPGFGVRVSPKGRKVFSVMYGKERRRVSLGRYPSQTLKIARREAFKLLGDNDGSNKKIGSESLSEARKDYLAECEAKNRPSTVESYKKLLNKVTDQPLKDVKKSDIDLSNSHQVMAWKVFMNWCLRNDLVERNPFVGIPASYGKRDRVLTSDEINKIWHYEDKPFSDIVKVLLLTGARRGEVFHLQNTDDGYYLPANKAKNHHAHLLPKMDLLEDLIPLPYFNGWGKSKKRMDTATGVTNYTLHDCRRTYATLHAEIGTPIHLVELLLNHVSNSSLSGIARVYNRYDYLKEAKEAVAKYERHFQTIIAQSN